MLNNVYYCANKLIVDHVFIEGDPVKNVHEPNTDSLNN